MDAGAPAWERQKQPRYLNAPVPATPVVLIRNSTSKCTVLEGIPYRQVELRCYVLICCNHVYETSFSRNHLNLAFFQCLSAGSLSLSGCNASVLQCPAAGAAQRTAVRLSYGQPSQAVHVLSRQSSSVCQVLAAQRAALREPPP